MYTFNVIYQHGWHLYGVYVRAYTAADARAIVLWEKPDVTVVSVSKGGMFDEYVR